MRQDELKATVKVYVPVSRCAGSGLRGEGSPQAQATRSTGRARQGVRVRCFAMLRSVNWAAGAILRENPRPGVARRSRSTSARLLFESFLGSVPAATVRAFPRRQTLSRRSRGKRLRLARDGVTRTIEGTSAVSVTCSRGHQAARAYLRSSPSFGRRGTCFDSVRVQGLDQEGSNRIGPSYPRPARFCGQLGHIGVNAGDKLFGQAEGQESGLGRLSRATRPSLGSGRRSSGTPTQGEGLGPCDPRRGERPFRRDRPEALRSRAPADGGLLASHLEELAGLDPKPNGREPPRCSPRARFTAKAARVRARMHARLQTSSCGPLAIGT